jgi:flagellar biosynthesis/type III secretory pathway M-ring protein FliF/YscJ
MIAAGYSEPMDASETAEIQRIRRLRRIAVIAAITLAVLVLVAVGVYLSAFVILSPMLG